MSLKGILPSIALIVLVLIHPQASTAQVRLLAIGSLTDSRAGNYADLSGLNNTLENGAAANLLGGLGSGIAYASGNTFLALPDRGPNAVRFDSLVDDTVTYIPRFHTVTMDLKPNNSAGLPFTLTPKLQNTTLLFSLTPLVYGTGAGLAVGSGVPPQNNFLLHYFSGRSDNFDPTQTSGNPRDARLDSEGIRLSNDGLRVYISDEYGPYVYEFDRLLGVRLRSFTLPDHLFVSNLSSIGNDEISGNTSGRTANKGMEGLAITPDGKTLVGIMQAALIQDAALGGKAKKLLRLVTIDIASGQTTHEYAYLLTTGSGVSEITALNQHEFLVDERDGAGRGDGSLAVVKQIFKIDLNGAVDVAAMDGTTAATHAVTKSLTPFLDVVQLLTANGIPADHIPAKLEGIAIGPDVKQGRTTLHTLWIANDNDFLTEVPDDSGTVVPNPNQFFVFGFTDADLSGSTLVPPTVQNVPFNNDFLNFTRGGAPFLAHSARSGDAHSDLRGPGRIEVRCCAPSHRQSKGNRYPGVPPNRPPSAWASSTAMSHVIHELGVSRMVTSSNEANTGPIRGSDIAAVLRYRLCMRRFIS